VIPKAWLFAYAIAKNLTVKTEYLTVNLGTPTALKQPFLVVVGVNIVN